MHFKFEAVSYDVVMFTSKVATKRARAVKSPDNEQTLEERRFHCAGASVRLEEADRLTD